MRRRIRDHTPDCSAEPLGFLLGDRSDGLQTVLNVVLEVMAVIVDGDLEIAEERSERGAIEQMGVGRWRVGRGVGVEVFR
jgi:hypothetical protein